MKCVKILGYFILLASMSSFSAFRTNIMDNKEAALTIDLLKQYMRQYLNSPANILVVDTTMTCGEKFDYSLARRIKMKSQDSDLYKELINGYFNMQDGNELYFSDSIMSSDTLKFVTAHEAWKVIEFNDQKPKKYPDANGFVSVSKLFHSTDGLHISFVVDYMCGFECGYMSMVFAEKKGEKWSIMNVEGMMVY